MKLKKVIALLLALVMLSALASCGGGSGEKDDSPAPSKSDSPAPSKSDSPAPTESTEPSPSQQPDDANLSEVQKTVYAIAHALGTPADALFSNTALVAAISAAA